MLPGRIHIFIILILIAILSCSKNLTPDGELISRTIREAAQAAQIKDVKGVLKYISPSYKDPMGNDRDAIKGILLYHFLRNETLSIFIVKEDIEAKGGKGKARLKVIFTGEKKPSQEIQELAKNSLGIYMFEIAFKKEKGRWLATSAIWNEIGFRDLL